MKVPASQLVSSEELLELDMGQWEGGVRAECYSPENLAIIRRDVWRFAPPGGESQKQVEERMLRYITQVVLPQLTPDRPALIVTHGLAIKCFLRGLLDSSPDMTRRIRLDNTAITEVGFQPDGAEQGWHILRVNDTMHLAAPAAAGGQLPTGSAADPTHEAALRQGTLEPKASGVAVNGDARRPLT
ncbi:hypothetical protein N2152v2_006288 [Parachlorella kessleri]